MSELKIKALREKEKKHYIGQVEEKDEFVILFARTCSWKMDNTFLVIFVDFAIWNDCLNRCVFTPRLPRYWYSRDLWLLSKETLLIFNIHQQVVIIANAISHIRSLVWKFTLLHLGNVKRTNGKLIKWLFYLPATHVIFKSVWQGWEWHKSCYVIFNSFQSRSRSQFVR